MKTKEAQVESETRIITKVSDTVEKGLNSIITALNQMNPDHASQGSVTVVSDSEDEYSDNADTTVLQRAQNSVRRTIKTLRNLNPVLSDKSITIGFCIKQFRTMAPPKQKTGRGRAAHATFQGEKHDRDPETTGDENHPPKRQQKGSSKNLPSCICGLNHLYPDCYYLNRSKAPDGWTPLIQVQSKIITTVNGDKRLRTNIERSLRRKGISLPNFWPQKDVPNQPESASNHQESINSTRSRAAHATVRSTFSTSTSNEFDSYFRLDNCADTHVCNDLSRFIDYNPSYNETLQFGDSGTYIAGTGMVAVHVHTPSGPNLLHLDNVAYVPGFHWNLINAHALEQQSLFFNTRTCWMEYSN